MAGWAPPLRAPLPGHSITLQDLFPSSLPPSRSHSLSCTGSWSPAQGPALPTLSAGTIEPSASHSSPSPRPRCPLRPLRSCFIVTTAEWLRHTLPPLTLVHPKRLHSWATWAPGSYHTSDNSIFLPSVPTDCHGDWVNRCRGGRTFM